jgi:DNA-binding transcriptional ArsR family regulator
MDEMFAILADPTRRHILELLAERERSVGELVDAFSISQPAISRHLRVLREAGFVQVRGEGQRHIYRLDAAPLAQLDAWLAHYRRFWTLRFDDLDRRLKERREQRAGEPQEH